MRHNYLMLFVLLLIFASGCAHKNNKPEVSHQNNTPTQPIRYETPSEQKSRLGVREKTIGEQGGYPQSDLENLKSPSRDGIYTDPYTNEESIRISEYLTKHKHIKQAQVASTHDYVVVSVLLSDHTDDAIHDKIASEVRKIVPNKEVVVYTDHIHWNRMKNLNARPAPAKGGKENVDDYTELKD